MNTQTMTISHRQAAPWEWSLKAQSATRLGAETHARWLVVTEGRVWLTQSGAGLEGDDVWLGAGERHRLPAGTEWVVEGWPQAKIELLEAPAPRLSAAPRWRAWPPALRAA